MDIILLIHSHLRWLILFIAVGVILVLTFGFIRRTKFSKQDRILAAIFTGMIDLQALLGLTYFLWSGFVGKGFPKERLEHATTMILAIVISHLSARWKNAADKLRYRNTLVAFVIALLLIIVGVMRLPQGWKL